MKKIITFITITAILTAFYIYKKKETTSNYNIAILYPITHDSLDKIKNSFIKTVSKDSKIKCDIYNGNGDRLLLRNQAQEILSKKYDLIFTIATSPIVLLAELANQKKDKTPIISCAGDISQVNRDALSILDISIGGEAQESEAIMNILINICNPKKIVIPYTSVPMIEKQIDKIRTISEKNSIELIAIPIYNQQEISLKLDHFLEGNTTDNKGENEVILVLQDNMIVAHIEQVINIAKRKNSIIFTSDLESVDRGATLGYAVDHDFCGQISGKQALKILMSETPIETIKDIQLRDNKLKINYKNISSSLLNQESLKKYESLIIK